MSVKNTAPEMGHPATRPTTVPRNWGRWSLDPTGEYSSLDIPGYGIYTSHPHQVRLFPADCDFPTFTAWLGRWVQHLQGKSWITPDDLWNFVEGAQGIYRD